MLFPFFSFLSHSHFSFTPFPFSYYIESFYNYPEAVFAKKMISNATYKELNHSLLEIEGQPSNPCYIMNSVRSYLTPLHSHAERAAGSSGTVLWGQKWNQGWHETVTSVVRGAWRGLFSSAYDMWVCPSWWDFLSKATSFRYLEDFVIKPFKTFKSWC